MRLYHLHGVAQMKLSRNFPSFFHLYNLIILLKLTWLIGFAALLQAGCETKRRTQPSGLSDVATLAGRNREFGEPFGLVCRDGTIYISDGQNGKIMTVSATGA